MFCPWRAAAVLMFACSAACALEISSFEVDGAGDAQIGFCGKFKVINVSMAAGRQGWKVEMPLDLGGYKNLFFTSPGLEVEVEKCFRGNCMTKRTNCSPEWEIIFSKKISENSAIIKVGFDSQLTAVFFLNKYRRAGVDTYRLSPPSDLKFTDKVYRKNLRDFIVKKAKDFL